MPIYEFYCEDCNTIFNFFSRRINTTTIPDCPKCSRRLQRQMSIFAVTGRAKEEDEDNPFPDLDEAKMERVLGELAAEAENINEDDPRQMAALMRKFQAKTGLDLGDGMEEALARLEAGEDPDKVEEEMGDLFDDEDPLGMLKKAKKAVAGYRPPPATDDTLYDLPEPEAA